MPVFKYNVINKEGKKLSGTIEAPDENTARTELNNLGFSILSLEKIDKVPIAGKNLKKFVFEAIDKNSKFVTGSIPSKTQEEAMRRLINEYTLTVSAIWPENASEENIAKARTAGTKDLQEKLATEMQNIEAEKKAETLEQEKEEQFTKTKIEYILKDINALLQKFDKELELDQKAEINKKINKLLRIKNSKNLNYILKTTEELLEFIQLQEKSLFENGYKEKRLELEIQTKNLLSELYKTSKPKSIGEDVLQKIEKWEKANIKKDKKGQKGSIKLLHKILVKIKNIFITPPEIAAIKAQIKIYNRQLWDFGMLYFKEPTKEYKQKVINSVKTIWKARKKAKHSLRHASDLLKKRSKKEYNESEENLTGALTEELNTLTGWLLVFYLIFYFISLYITTKDFGLTEIPQGFYIYGSKLFKYILAILFLLHSTTSIKINFFKKNFIANIFLIPIFFFSSIIVILNF